MAPQVKRDRSSRKSSRPIFSQKKAESGSEKAESAPGEAATEDLQAANTAGKDAATASSSESATRSASDSSTETAAPPPPAELPVPYDPASDVGLAREVVTELQHLLHKGRFAQMRPYLDELYLILGYLEVRHPRSLLHLTILRTNHLLNSGDGKAALRELARARQELRAMPEESAADLSALLDPTRDALTRGNLTAARDALERIQLEPAPGDFGSVASELRKLLASIDLDLARQSRRLLEMELQDLDGVLLRLGRAVKSPGKAGKAPAGAGTPPVRPVGPVGPVGLVGPAKKRPDTNKPESGNKPVKTKEQQKG